MAGNILYNSDLELDGKLILNYIPDASGEVLTYNLQSKQVGKRSYSQLISDMGLATVSWSNTTFIPKSHPVFNVTQAQINNWDTNLNRTYSFAEITNKPTTIAGYGITDAYSKTESDGRFVPYTGATQNVNLGTRSITSTGGFIGNANTATKLANIITTFSGTYPLTVNVNGTIYSHEGLTYTGSTGTLAANTFIGALSGNATTASTLATARTIALSGGATGTATSFNGSANITIPVTGLNATNLNAGTVPLDRLKESYGALADQGPILTLGAITGGAGYTDGTYNSVALTGGNGGGVTANITVSGGIVTSVVLVEAGAGYKSGNSLSAAVANIGGTGSGFSVLVSTVRTATIHIKNLGPRIRLQNSDTSLSAGQEIGSILFSSMDTSTNGRGDNVRLVGVAESTSGGGALQIWTTTNAGQPTLAAAFHGNNDFRLYNSTGTFYHAITNNPTANRTLNLPNGNVTLVTGTMVPTTGTGATGTWGINVSGSAATLTTARTLTIGNTGKTFNGSGNVSWTLAEIGAMATTHAANAISATNITNWNTSFGWGNHATQGYLKLADLNGQATQAWVNANFDKYTSWNLKTEGVQRVSMTSGSSLDIRGGTNVTTSYEAGGVITINSTDTTYTAGSGIGITGTTITNSAPNIDQKLSISGMKITLDRSGGTVTVPSSNLVTSTTATGLTNLATTNTNTYLNIVEGGTTLGSSTQIIGSGSVTVSSDANGKLTINGVNTNTTYTGSSGITLSGTDFRPTYGTAVNTIAQGNDSRINNGQTAFEWDNHATQGYLKLANLPNPALVTSTTAAGTTNATTTNTNTFLNIVYNGGSIGSSTQITGAGSVTVSSDTAGKLIITGTNTTYSAGTLAILQAATPTTTNYLWSSKNLNDWINGKFNPDDYIKNFYGVKGFDWDGSGDLLLYDENMHTHTILSSLNIADYAITDADSRVNYWTTAYSWGNHASAGYATQTWSNSNFIPKTHPVFNVTQAQIDNWAIKDGSNASGIWKHAAYGLDLNPTINGGTIDGRGATNSLRNATYGTVGGVVQDSADSPNPNQWTNRIKILHPNSQGYFTELAHSFTGEEGLWHRRLTAGVLSPYVKLLDTNNGVTLDTPQDITGRKIINTTSNPTTTNLRLRGDTSTNPTLAFLAEGRDWGGLQFNGSFFSFTNVDGTGFKSVKATQFIRNGGTSTQVMMADGSVKELSAITGTTYTEGTNIKIVGTVINVQEAPVFGGTVTAHSFKVNQTDGQGQGISLYGHTPNFGSTTYPEYGLYFGTTSTSGTHGGVVGDWATYFTMNGLTNRGWIFKHSGSNVASISSTGQFTGSSFFESSLRKYKTNIQPFTNSALDLIGKLDIVTYDRTEGMKDKIGIIADDSPKEFLSEKQEEVDLYKTIFIQAKAIQELRAEIDTLKKMINNVRL